MESNFTLDFKFTKKYFDFSCIYKITTPSGKIYIGQTQKLFMRFYDYRRMKTNSYLKKALLKYGLENITVEILEKDIPLEKLDEREQFYLDTLQPFDDNGYNICREASTTRGRKRPKSELINTIEASKKRVGELNHMFGKTHSEEARKKISQPHLGKVISEECKLKMSETRKINSARCINQLDLINKNIINNFLSVKDASEKTGVSKVTIYRIANKIKNEGKDDWVNKPITGYFWEFCD